MIKVLVCDGDETVFGTGKEKDLIDGLTALNIKLAVASNGKRGDIEAKFSNYGLPIPSFIVTPADIGNKKKPSPEFIYEIARQAHVELSEMAFLGDDDKTDTFCAINAGILPLSAVYSKAVKPREYGIPISDIDYLLRILNLYCSQSPKYFGWTYLGTCPTTNTTIDIRSLLYQHGAIPSLKELIKGMIPPKSVLIGPRNIGLYNIISLYLLTRIYLHGDFSGGDKMLITVYPGHRMNTANALLETFAENTKAAFRVFQRDLLIRHKDAIKSTSTARSSRDALNQLNTIHINPLYREKVQGKHIFVLDDYTTSGYSFETARHMLIQAGAEKVTCIAIGKYANSHRIIKINKTGWDPFVPTIFMDTDIRAIDSLGEAHPEADDAFQEVYNFLDKN